MARTTSRLSVWVLCCALGVAGCGGDGGVAQDGGRDSASEDGAIGDGAIGDGSIEDGAIGDSASADGSIEDGSIGDSGSADGSIEDSAIEDAGSGDSAAGDAGSVDAGACTSCAVGETCCAGATGNVCVDLATDVDHCGVCGATCDGVCAAGVCLAGPLDAGVDASGDAGVDPGVCSPSCGASERCCGGSCANRMAPAGVIDGRTDSSFSNCNGCGLACDPQRASLCGILLGGFGPPQCMCGSFAQCPIGQVCAPTGSGFTCRDLSTDPNNCGVVGNVCGEGETCVAGSCGCGAGAACSAAQACCGGACVDVTSDATNCGGCGVACNVGETCAAGSCGCGATGVVCRPAVPDIFGGPATDPGESCCGGVCVANTDTSCACVVCDTAVGNFCQVAGGPFGTGAAPEVCCGGSEVPLLGCGGPGGDGGLPFP